MKCELSRVFDGESLRGGIEVPLRGRMASLDSLHFLDLHEACGFAWGGESENLGRYGAGI